MYFFTADEHYGHHNIIRYCNRPFKSVKDMDETLIHRHNTLITPADIVIHAGDFTLKNKEFAERIIRQLNGSHVFLRGSHDNWLNKGCSTMWEKKIEEWYVVVCHYAMLTWPRSHYNSWQLFGHSHGMLDRHNEKVQLDIGVDTNNFFPYSWEQIKRILAGGATNDV